MYNPNKAQLSKTRVHISWDILYLRLQNIHVGFMTLKTFASTTFCAGKNSGFPSIWANVNHRWCLSCWPEQIVKQLLSLRFCDILKLMCRYSNATDINLYSITHFFSNTVYGIILGPKSNTCIIYGIICHSSYGYWDFINIYFSVWYSE